MADPRESAHPDASERWAALTGPIPDAAMAWAEQLLGVDEEVRRAS